MSFLGLFKDKKVRVITTDGRFFDGKLESFDLSTNIVLLDTREIILGDPQDPEDETQVISLGVYFIRGNAVVCCALDESEPDWSEVSFLLVQISFMS